MKRRSFIKTAGAGAMIASLATSVPMQALALTNTQARDLVDQMIGEINGIINSGESESRMLRDFESLFARYANTTVIALRVLGADGRALSNSQRNAFIQTFRTYIARKYGRRFREFIGGRIEVDGTQAVNSWFEVETTVHMQGEAPFRVDFLVREADGQDLFFDMLIEGISLTRVEREEIGAMLDRRGGDINRLITDLRNAG